MSEDTGFQFTDDAVPRAYEEVLVPRLFEPWALLLLDECNLRPRAVVLDVCAKVVNLASWSDDSRFRSRAARARSNGDRGDAGIEALKPSEQMRRATRIVEDLALVRLAHLTKRGKSE
jgi:hypothetical protein